MGNTRWEMEISMFFCVEIPGFGGQSLECCKTRHKYLCLDGLRRSEKFRFCGTWELRRSEKLKHMNGIVYICSSDFMNSFWGVFLHALGMPGPNPKSSYLWGEHKVFRHKATKNRHRPRRLGGRARACFPLSLDFRYRFGFKCPPGFWAVWFAPMFLKNPATTKAWGDKSFF